MERRTTKDGGNKTVENSIPNKFTHSLIASTSSLQFDSTNFGGSHLDKTNRKWSICTRFGVVQRVVSNVRNYIEIIIIVIMMPMTTEPSIVSISLPSFRFWFGSFSNAFSFLLLCAQSANAVMSMEMYNTRKEINLTRFYCLFYGILRISLSLSLAPFSFFLFNSIGRSVGVCVCG